MRFALVLALAACGSGKAATPLQTPVHQARIPRAPGQNGPSLVQVQNAGESAGEQLADVDGCASCHPDVAAQWSASAHSFASFGNPIYRYDVEQVRAELGKPASRHCGGCHDMPLLVDGLMTNGQIAADDLRAHSGVTCRLCHGVKATTYDGNGSYVWDGTPIDTDSIERHKQQVTTKVDTTLCIGCHRGFLSPDMGMPVHLSGLDETGMWQSSPYTGNGMGRVDKVEQKTCIDCHMDRVPASKDELGAKHGTVASHRFVGGHTWMASMRGDGEQLKLTQAKLEGAASIDIAGARVDGELHLPADGAPVRAGSRLELDVVLRNLLVGHRFPGGVLDVADTWVELELTDAHGKRIASSGLAHETDPNDRDSHVLRTLVVDDKGAILERHEMAQFRGLVTTQTLAPRDAQAVRYGFDVPAKLAQPVTVTARLRHRSRSLKMQEEACRAAREPAGKAFLAGAKGARAVTLDPCKPQPITLIAQTSIELGDGANPSTARPAWEREYELGMALAATIVTRLEEARAVLTIARASAPDDRARAMVDVQLGWVASKQNRVADAVELIAEARRFLGVKPDGTGAKDPPVMAAVLADTYARANRWAEAVAPARSCTERAPKNAAAWSLYARVLVAVSDFSGALAATSRGLELAPRDPDLLRAQATALAGLKDPATRAAQEAYERFRVPDESAVLRIRCAQKDATCWRDRNPVHTLELR